MTAPVAISCALHALALAPLWGRGDGRRHDFVRDLRLPERLTIRSVSIEIPPRLPPPPVRPLPQRRHAPAPEPHGRATPSAKPHPRPWKGARRLRRRRPARRSPAPSAPVAIATKPRGSVAFQASEGSTEAAGAAPAPISEPGSSRAPPAPSGHYDLSGYGAALYRALLAHRRYPEQALELELEGEVVVRITIDRRGRLVRPARVARSSGHACLDREARRMVAAAAPFAALPSDCPRDTAVFTVPIRFELDDDAF